MGHGIDLGISGTSVYSQLLLIQMRADKLRRPRLSLGLDLLHSQLMKLLYGAVTLMAKI